MSVSSSSEAMLRNVEQQAVCGSYLVNYPLSLLVGEVDVKIRIVRVKSQYLDVVNLNNLMRL